jgi:ATP-dependent Zn protease
LAKNNELDRSIDRSLDGFGRFLRRKWWLVLILLVVGWYVVRYVLPVLSVPQPGDILAFVLQASIMIFFILVQFIALFWFLGRPRIYWVMPGETGLTFADYKGNPEVLEAARRIVILLRGVKSFKAMGGEISRGLLLVGPPGTGKSYLAQCIATESGVPFAYASAASFKAMFIGMDVLMIKNLYRKARRMAREYGGCIIFMDEFDAIGTSRGGMGNNIAMGGGFMGMGGTGGLNELLMQMDPPPMDNSWWKKALRSMGLYHGKSRREPVLTVAATNIPDSLDAALLRPGRFDRKIVVEAPTDDNRAEVIEYYLAKVTHEPNLSMGRLVSDMQGYTPVAIKHVINEAVIMAHFDGRGSIRYRDIALAIQTHEFGLRSPRQLSALEKRRIAYHEAGHAIAQAKLLPRWRVAHATIAKRLDTHGEAYVQPKPMEEIVTESADEIFEHIEVCLASRAAEEIFLNTRLNGVGGDLHQATQLALRYVAHWGMGDSFFSAAATLSPERMYTDPVLRMEVESVLRRAYGEVRALIERHRAAVIAVAEALISREDLTGEEIEQLIRQAEISMLAPLPVGGFAQAMPGMQPYQLYAQQLYPPPQPFVAAPDGQPMRQGPSAPRSGQLAAPAGTVPNGPSNGSANGAAGQNGVNGGSGVNGANGANGANGSAYPAGMPGAELVPPDAPVQPGRWPQNPPAAPSGPTLPSQPRSPLPFDPGI